MTCRFPSASTARLLSAPLALLVVLPVAALERLPPPENRPNAGLLAQVKSEIPPEVQGWFDAAKTAAAKGDSAEALRLQKQVVAWVKANRPALDVFRARALINFGTFLSAVGQRQEALAPTEEAVRILRQVEVNQPEPPRFLAMALTNLGIRYSNLGRRQEALAPTEEAVRIYRELEKTNPAFLPDVAVALINLGVRNTELGRHKEALAQNEEAVKIYRELAKYNPAYLPDVAVALNNMGIRTDAEQMLPAADLSYLPKNDPTNALKRSVVRLWPTFAGQKTNIGLRDTGFVVRRDGERSWIVTAMHVVRDPDDYSIATKVEAELFTGPLPAGLLPPMLQVVRVPVPAAGEAGEDLIVLELRGLPPDVQPLPLSAVPPQGPLTVVGHPSGSVPWTVLRYPLLKATPILLLDGPLEEGASGSPVLTPGGQVAGVVYRSSGKGEPVPLVYAYPSRSIQGKLP
jgi:tetratricopeptide (TPR) repeat protein